VVQPPSQPRNVKATPQKGALNLTWQAPSTGAPITGYRVYRWSAGSPVTVITLNNVTSYKATGLTKGVIYSFQVSASNSGGEGAKSSTVNAKPS